MGEGFAAAAGQFQTCETSVSTNPNRVCRAAGRCHYPIGACSPGVKAGTPMGDFFDSITPMRYDRTCGNCYDTSSRQGVKLRNSDHWDAAVGLQRSLEGNLFISLFPKRGRRKITAQLSWRRVRDLHFFHEGASQKLARHVVPATHDFVVVNFRSYFLIDCRTTIRS
jgi:hypothetical protein